MTPDKSPDGERGTAIVTGASRGIGAAIATRLADDGFTVVVNYTADAEGAEAVVSGIRGSGGRAWAIRADVASPDDVDDLFARVGRELGPLTALVNNAGVVGQFARVEEQGSDVLTRLMQVNVTGPMLCCKYAIKMMSKTHGGRGGSIVNVASVAARTGGLTGLVPYAASKGALVTLSRGLSNEVAPEGIRVNSVSPGVVATELASTVEAKEAAADSPMGRMGQPDEVAAAVSWLVSAEASFVTGSDLVVSGGR
jgi:NAD(P)-dependent dehydrogenase (short-subunit alcohol dehydrogenase family)